MKLRIQLVYLLLAFLIILDSCEFYGNKDLGHKFTLFARDSPEGHYDIVYCSTYDIGGCIAGMNVLPKGDDKYYMFVETAKFNDKWIIAKTRLTKNGLEQFWIIDKNFTLDDKFNVLPLSEKDGMDFKYFIDNKVQGPYETDKFKMKLVELEIDLNFD